MRWALILQEFDFEIKYKRGSAIKHADALCRLACEETSIKTQCRHDQVLNMSINEDSYSIATPSDILNVRNHTTLISLNFNKEEMKKDQQNDPSW